ncbi:MAG: hypothetical protein E5Y64_31625 [Mesorhizobium sp.]|nr:MAG: hypothetical protein E5Y64_31625 [Mesorhizobium sp.]
MRVWRMRTGISFTVSPTNRQRLSPASDDRTDLTTANGLFMGCTARFSLRVRTLAGSSFTHRP